MVLPHDWKPSLHGLINRHISARHLNLKCPTWPCRFWREWVHEEFLHFSIIRITVKRMRFHSFGEQSEWECVRAQADIHRESRGGKRGRNETGQCPACRQSGKFRLAPCGDV